MKNKSNLIYFAFGICMVLVIAFFPQLKAIVESNGTDYSSNSSTTEKSSSEKPTDSEAKFMAKDICKGQLKSPSSAKWGSSVTVTSLGNDKYSVHGTVEAENSYGVMIMNEYYAYFTFTGKGYTDGYCSITSK